MTTTTLAADPAAAARAALRDEREQLERQQYAAWQRLNEIRAELAALPSEESEHW